MAVPGVQDGTWPDLRPRGSLLGVEHLIDAVAGLDPSHAVSRTAPLLAEERRLLLLAASRARHTLLVSAVRGEDEQPSRFLDELEGTDADADAVSRPISEPGRGLSLPELVAELRRVTCDGDGVPDVRERAAAGLARLAAAGVPGAHPDSWYGLAAVSTGIALRTRDEVAVVSPSVVELVSTCPLRWFLTRHGGQDARALPAVTGSLVHGLVQAAAAGATDQQLDDALRSAWTAVDAGAPWFSRREQDRVRDMLGAFRTWLARTRQQGRQHSAAA